MSKRSVTSRNAQSTAASKSPRGVARFAVVAALLAILVLGLVLGPLTGLGAAFGKQAADLTRYVQQLVVEHKPSDASDLESLPYIGPAVAWLQDTVGISLAQIQAMSVEAALTRSGRPRWRPAESRSSALPAFPQHR